MGAYKKGSMIAGNNVAEIVVVLKTLPTKTAVEALGTKVWESSKSKDSQEGGIHCSFPMNYLFIRMNTNFLLFFIVLTFILNEGGFDISSLEATVNVLIATVLPNMRKLDSQLHLKESILLSAHVAIRRSRYGLVSSTL